jgi:N6-adenosine-specific RNA methylase IME4
MTANPLLPVIVESQLTSSAAALELVKQIHHAGLRALTQTEDVAQLQQFHTQAAALEHYLARLVRDRNAYFCCQQWMAELRLRAERLIGRWLAHHVNHEGGGDRRSEARDATASHDLPAGVSKSQSSRWQRVARVPDVVFERYIVVARDARKEISTAGLLKLAEALRTGPDGPSTRPAESVSRTVEELSALARRNLRFGTIYVDPPWRYQNTATRGAAANHDPTMSVDEIKALPVAELAAEASHLHLWATTPLLPEALAILLDWGFQYKGIFVWTKEHIGLGNYWRSAHEYLLLGVRGDCPFRDRGQRSWQCLRPGRHSEKPEEVRGIIEKVSPPPYIELFTRRLTEGWMAWGNEVDGTRVGATVGNGLVSSSGGNAS